MIAAIRGPIEAVGPDWVVVDVGGVSLRVSVPTSTVSRLPAIGHVVRLVTHLYLREDQLALYGFFSPDELAFFEQVITVSGVGPKLALAMLSAAPSETLRQAIASESLDALTRVPGIGKKLAARLILELRGKLTAAPGAPVTVTSTPDQDVLAALVGLGYTPADATLAIQNTSGENNLDLEERIRRALQFFARR
jgi:Holliday junction DNA helicase RuvA